MARIDNVGRIRAIGKGNILGDPFPISVPVSVRESVRV